jgi:hypothetical protein
MITLPVEMIMILLLREVTPETETIAAKSAESSVGAKSL